MNPYIFRKITQHAINQTFPSRKYVEEIVFIEGKSNIRKCQEAWVVIVLFEYLFLCRVNVT